MNYRRLGADGPEVSEVSLGSWLTLGERLDLAASRACFTAALDCGIDLFDTADVYAGGAAEQTLGGLIADVPRASVRIATKCFFPQSAAPADGGLSRRHILASVERSLRHLRTDYIDLMQCHRFDPEVPLEETVGAMDELVRAGKIRAWGIGRFDAGQTARAVEVARESGAAVPISNQYFYSFLNREIEAAVLPRCAELGLGVLAYSPLAQGVLTGKYAGSSIPPGSRAADQRLRSGMWQFRPEHIARVERLREIAIDAGLSLAQLALAWCLRTPAVTSVIIGASSPEQVRENAAASGARLTPELLARMEAA